MKLSHLNHHFKRVMQQRNLFFLIVFVMGINQMILMIGFMWRGDKTVFLPPVMDQPFSIHGSAYSATYYEQMGLFLGNLLLSKSSETAEQQNALVYKYVAPEVLGVFERDLTEEALSLKKDKAAYVFYPSEVRVNLGTKSVLLIGERHTFVGSQKVDVVQERYRLSFVQRGHKMYLRQFELEVSRD